MILPKTIVQAKITENISLTEDVKKLTVYAPDICHQARPGQFVHIRIVSSCDPLLRRPLSIAGADIQRGTVTFIYRIVGVGTRLLARMTEGDVIDCMGPLGNGFKLECSHPLLIGGGMGTAPLVFLAQRLCPRPLEIIMGGRSREEMFWADILATLCDNIHITTDDGTLGRRGVTVDLLPELLKGNSYDMIYACGPRPMLERVARLASESDVPCQISLEEHMACGVGACLSCTCASKHGGRKKVCSDGPVFWSEEVIW